MTQGLPLAHVKTHCAFIIDWVSYDHSLIWPQDIWPRTFDHFKILWHMTTVTFDHVTFDRKWHLTASDIWPRDIWPQVTFDRGTFDRSDIWPRDIWPQWHLTAGRLTAGRLTTGHLTAVTFDRGILDRQPRLEKLDRKWHLTAGPLTASDVWPRDVWPQWHLTTGFWTGNQD